MAKRGSTRPWRVRFTWTDPDGSTRSGCETRSTFEEAQVVVGQLAETARSERIATKGSRVSGSITYRDGSIRLAGGRVVESVTFAYGPEPDVDDAAPVVRATDDPEYDEAAQQDAEGFSCLVELLAGTDHGTGYYQPGTVEPLDAAETAYDGSTAPQVRELTARERDVLCRLLTQALHDPRFRDEQTYTFAVVRQVLDPRR